MGDHSAQETVLREVKVAVEAKTKANAEVQTKLDECNANLERLKKEKEEEARKAEEAKKAEQEAKIAEEAKKAEEAKIAEEAKKAEEEKAKADTAAGQKEEAEPAAS